MRRTLQSGEYYGAAVRRLNLGPILVTETRHRAGALIPPHAHRNAYFCFVRQGVYVERFGQKSRDCAPLTLAFHTADETHSEQITGSDVSSLNIEVTAEWLRNVQECAPRLRDPFDCQGGIAAWLAARVYREFRRGDASSRLMIEGILLEVVAECARSVRPSATAPPWLLRAREALRARFRENVSPGEVASEARVHPVHLAAAFRKHFGQSAGEFVRMCRVEFATARLACQGVSLADIALDAGFADQSHFTRTFKRLTGLTPAAFRRAAIAD